MWTEQNKKVRLAARRKYMEWKEKCIVVDNNNDNDLEEDDHEDDAIVIDVGEYMKAVDDDEKEEKVGVSGEKVGSTDFESVSSSDEDDNDDLNDEDYSEQNVEVCSSIESSSSEEESEEKEMVCKDADVANIRNNNVNDNGGRKSYKHDKKGKERVSSAKFHNRVPASPVMNAGKKNSTGERIEKEAKLGSVQCPITVEMEETGSYSTSSSISGDDKDNNNHNNNKDNVKDNDRTKFKDNDDSLRNCSEDGGKREEGRPEKQTKKKLPRKKLKVKEIENILLNTILENGSAEGLEGIVSSVNDQDDLPRKFRFGDDKCDKQVEDAVLCESAVLQEKLCRKGKHYLVLDEEIGIKLPEEQNINSDKFQFPESNNDFGAAHEDDTRGTVWDLIPGIKRTLYEHQQQGFEFIWRNISGGIKMEELDKPSKYGVGGCIICHAPGTGKTRLAIVFLQSYLKQYPMSKPVIIAPSSMLLTWEEEFARWNIGIPFLNLNSPELSSKEIEVLGFVGEVKRSKAVRKTKLCIWTMGKGILGISYTLFEKLAGERKGTEERIKRALLDQPGLLFLDEGHTPRNDESNIWKVFSEVNTKKRIILSGTPFQNNFDELNNTLSLIREEFRDPFIRGNYVKGRWKSKMNRNGLSSSKVDEERRIQDLRNRMKPFVHVHKGEILRKTLRGLFHSVLVLKPSDLQKTYFRYLAGIKCCLLSDYLVCIASIHPSMLSMCDQVPDSVDKTGLDKHKTDLNVGVKIKFLLELIKLSKGEKVLYLLMVGKQRATQRQSSIGLFNDPRSEARVLLASIKACSEGIHLVGASRVVLLDVVWNPSVERQAISRAYRLGQKKDVYVYHLITSGTQEGEKYYRQVAKDRVSEQVFTSSEGDGGQKASTLSRVSEDRILEEMIQHERMKYMFDKIIYQPKADKLIESFAPLNL
ncbi:SNF2 domain-containing protein CLASSY 3 [Bienertia sinuspersici]